MRSVISLVILLCSTIASGAESYRELYIKPSATNASNINGGSSEDRKFQRTNGNWNTTTKVFTATGDTLNSSWVGQLACVCNDGTTVGAYFAEVTAIDNTAKTISLSTTRTAGTAPTTSATGRTITIGGAWSGPSGSTSFPFGTTLWASVTNSSGDRVRINMHATTYSSANAHVHDSPSIVIEGYSSAPGDGGFAEMDYTGASNAYTLRVGSTASGVFEIRNIWFHHNSTVSTPDSGAGLYISPSGGTGFAIVKNCRFSDCVGPAFQATGSTNTYVVIIEGCEFFDCGNNTVPQSSVVVRGSLAHEMHIRNCIFHDNGSNVSTCIETASSQGSVAECVFDSNTVAISEASVPILSNCVFYNNGTAISYSPGSTRFGLRVRGCVFENNTTAISRGNTTANREASFERCVFYNNTTKYDSNATGRVFEVNCVDATRGCMVDPANGDFRLRESIYRGMINESLLQSSSYYSKTTSFNRSPGIEPSNPFYRGR